MRARHSRALARSLAVAAALIAFTSLAGEARATNGAKLIAVGSRAEGRGGTDTGIADDATALGTNPGGIGFIDGQRIDSALGIYVPRIRWKNADDDTRSAEPALGAIWGGSFGFVFDFDTPWHVADALTFGEDVPDAVAPRSTADYAGSGLKFGFGAFPIGGSYTHFSSRSPLFPNDPQGWSSELKEVAWTLGIGWRISRLISIGLSPQFITGLPGTTQFAKDEPITQPVSVLKGHPIAGSDVTYGDLAPFFASKSIEGVGNMQDMHTFGFRVRLGVLLAPVEWETGRLTLGLSYATQSFKQDYLGTARVDFTRQMNVLDPNGTAGIKSAIAANTGIPEDQQTYVGRWNLRLSPLNAPQEVSGGFGLTLLDRVLLAGDVTWINWSATEDKVHGSLTNGTSIELNELTGGSSTTLDVPLKWKDQVVIALGVSVAALDWLTLRVGYNYGNDPVPSSTLEPTTPAIFEHHATAGASIYVRRIELSIAYEHDFAKKVHIGASEADGDVSNSTILASLDAVMLGMGVRF